jgi:hypothetical protein
MKDMTYRTDRKGTPFVSMKAALVPVLAVALAGCQPEGSSDSSGTPAPTPVDGSVLSRAFVESFEPYEDDARFLIQRDSRYTLQDRTWYFDGNGNQTRDASEQSYSTYPLQSSGVHFAHAAGLTGAGQIIAVTDSGFLADHEAFAGKTIHTSGTFPERDHGTLVASVAAGNSSTMIGMAPGADLAFGSYDTFASRAAAARQAEQLGAVALNNSWGFTDAPATRATFDRIFSSSASRDYLSALRSYAETGVVIFAASNGGADAQSSLMPALPSLEPGLEAGWLAVINAEAEMSGDDVIGGRRISAACLESARWCLAAEGSWKGASAAATDAYSFSTGASFAAPMVAGAMAILGEAFPDLSPHDLRIRLLASADNEFTGFNATGEVELAEGFVHAISDEWGHGFLDVKAALLPIGTTTATLGDGTTYDVAEPLAVEGQATGDAVTRALSNVSLVVDDALSARFSVSADELVARPGQRPLADELERDWRSGGAAGCCGLTSFYPDTRLLGGTSDDLSVNVMMPFEPGENDSFGMTVGQRFDSDIGDLAVNLSVGRDGGALLPRWFTGGGSAIVAGSLDWSAPISGKSALALGAGFGSTLGQGGGIGGSASFTSAKAEFVTRDLFEGGDRLAFSFGLPVAVAGGHTTLELPVQTRSGTVEHRAVGIDLAPDSREVRLGISYDFPVTARSDVVLSAAHAENFGNVTGERSTGLFVGLRTRF